MTSIISPPIKKSPLSLITTGGSLVLNRPPTPIITSGPYTLPCPGTVTLQGSLSSDINNDPITHRWELVNPVNPTVTLTRNAADPVSTNPDNGIPAGTYTATLTVTDAKGSRAAASSTVTVAGCAAGAPAGNLPPNVGFRNAPYTVTTCAGSSVPLDGGATIDPNGE
jgi:hypothetical protein